MLKEVLSFVRNTLASRENRSRKLRPKDRVQIFDELLNGRMNAAYESSLGYYVVSSHYPYQLWGPRRPGEGAPRTLYSPDGEFVQSYSPSYSPRPGVETLLRPWQGVIPHEEELDKILIELQRIRRAKGGSLQDTAEDEARREELPFPTKDEIQGRLTQDFSYKADVAQSMACELIKMHPILRKHFSTWWYSGSLPEALEISGYPVRRINQLRPDAKLPAIFEIMDWFILEPEEAISGFESGYDTVT